MAEPEKRPVRLISRPQPRFRQVYVTEPDAVNETLRASGLGPEVVAARQEAIRGQQEHQKRQAQQKKADRDRYRARKKAEREQRALQGQPTVFEYPVEFMSDEAIDAAIEKERQDAAFRASQPQISQGYDRPQVNTNRLADQYSTVSNFYASLGSPNMMPMMNEQQVRSNPGLAATRLDFGLNDPALTVLQIATPMGEGTGAWAATKTAFGQGMRAAKPFATRVLSATGDAAMAGGKAIAQNAPKVAGNAVIMSVPVSAAAADFGNEDPNNPVGSNQGSSAMPWIIGTGALIGGGYAMKRFRPNWITWWERNPNTLAANARYNALRTRYNTAFQAGDQAAMDALKTELGKSPSKTMTQGTGRKAKTVDDPNFISNTDLGTMIQNREYPATEGFMIESRGDKFWRGVRNWGVRFPAYTTAIGNAGMWMFGGGNQQATQQQWAPDYRETDAAVTQGSAPSDTIVLEPLGEEVPDANTIVPGGPVWKTTR